VSDCDRLIGQNDLIAGSGITITRSRSKVTVSANYSVTKTVYENGGVGEIDVTGLSGLLADDQHVLDAEVIAAISNFLPWMIDIDVFMTAKAHVGWDTYEVFSLCLNNGMRMSSGWQNDSITWDVVLAAGTWTFELLHSTSDAQGIYSIQFDSVEKGTIDGYSAVPTYNVRSSVTDIFVPTTAKIALKIKMATKNSSSSSYIGYIHGVRLIRTV
jgi:hypothetical protein